MTRTSPADRRFTLDANILVYSVDNTDPAKERSAAEIVNRAVDVNCLMTLQAFSEFYAVVTRKQIAPANEAADLVRDWLMVFPTTATSVTAIRRALEYAMAGRASYWDALLLATAAEAGCGLILTEDMADGATLTGVEIHNPFSPSGDLTGRARALLGG